MRRRYVRGDRALLTVDHHRHLLVSLSPLSVHLRFWTARGPRAPDLPRPGPTAHPSPPTEQIGETATRAHPLLSYCRSRPHQHHLGNPPESPYPRRGIAPSRCPPPHSSATHPVPFRLGRAVRPWVPWRRAGTNGGVDRVVVRWGSR
jgi:hypothetical protein